MIKIKLLYIALLQSTTTTTIFCSGKRPSITKITSQISKLSTFSSLLSLSKLDDIFDDCKVNGEFTVFAPTNSAFRRLNDKFIKNLEKEDNHVVLSEFLLFHVVPKKLRLRDLGEDDDGDNDDDDDDDDDDDELLETTMGGFLEVKRRRGGRRIRIRPAERSVGAKIKQEDVRACNGIVHVVNSVLIPPKDLVIFDKDFNKKR